MKKQSVSSLCIKTINDGLAVHASINSMPTSFIIDTGAAVSLVPSHIIPQKSDVQPMCCRLRAAGDVEFFSIGKVELQFTLGKISFRHTFLVVDAHTPAILGLDFLSTQQAIVNLRDFQLEFERHSIPLVRPSSTEEENVVLRTEVCLPARSDSFVSVPGHVANHIETVLITEADGSKLPDGVFVGRTLASSKQLGWPVRLINTNSSMVKLPAETVIAKAYEVDILAANDKVTDGLRVDSESFALPEDLPSTAQESFRKLLSEFNEIFSSHSSDFGRTSLVQHEINTGDAVPIRQASRREPLAKRKVVADLVAEMASRGVIEKSSSPWSSPVVLVKKKDGSVRFCVDYRRLNDVTQKDSYPLPRMDDILATLSGSQWFSTMDLQSGYWQVEMHPESKSKTAFTCGAGLWQFNVMPFGLCNAPATFERLMDGVLTGLPWNTALVYLDDIIVHSQSADDHVAALREVFGRLRNAGLKLSPTKCHFFQKRVRYLGHIVSRTGLEVDPDKTNKVASWPVPTNKTEVKSFLGLCSYYRKFVKGFSTIARPLVQLTELRTQFNWSNDTQHAFDILKQKLTSAPILAFPDTNLPFILDTDASNSGIGAVLSQVENGEEKVIEYYSRSLDKAERNYCVTRKELLAVVVSVSHFRHYLLGREFTLRTDHASLRWLYNFRSPEGQVARWLERLQEYNFAIHHRAGAKYNNADALSRRPCGDCRNCERAEKNDGQNIFAVGVVSEDLQTAQKEDTCLNKVFLWVQQKKRPTKDDIMGEDPETKSYWAIFDRLDLRNDTLVRVWLDGAEERAMPVLPKSWRDSVIKQLHNSPTGGHLGISKTLCKLKHRYYWVGMSEDVKRWCAACHTCGSRKGPGRPIVGKLQPSLVGAPFERIVIDILGPLPRTDNGNRYIAVVMDYFTKWPECLSLPDQTAEVVAHALASEVFTRYGVPHIIHSDQGRNFESDVFRHAMEFLGADKTRTTPLRPQSDGMVERFNRTLLDYLAKFTEINQRNWDKLLPFALMAYRSSEHASTKASPARLLFGRELRLPIDLMFGAPSTERQELPRYVENLKSTLLSIHQLARGHLKLTAESMKQRYDLRSNLRELQPDDNVWVYAPTRAKGRCPKLQSDWVGPATVINKISDLVYRVRLPGRKAPWTLHVNRLAPYTSSHPFGQEARS